MKPNRLLFALPLVFLITGCKLPIPIPFLSSSSSSSENSSNSEGSEQSSKSTSQSSGSQSSSGTSTSTSSQSSTSSSEDSSVDAYYRGISDSSTGETLKTALFNLIKITTAGWSYDGLWTAYKTSDVRPDGKHFWDIYSDTTMYTLDDKRINASYKKEGDSINREHVIPQGSFNEAAPMKSDIHHVLPSDGYVNNRRNNYAHGEVSSATYTSNDGCKLGSPKVSGAPSPVFEPMNHYKGDIARIYFYFVTCYQNKMSSNSFAAFNQTTFPSIKPVLLPTYLKWHLEDAVSEKETIRNNVAYSGQHNRNPFIDRPEYACKIWGNVNAETKALCGIS